MRKISSLIIALCITASVSAQPNLSLEDAIELGLKNNFDIQIARNDARIAGNNRGRGLAGFLPDLDASAGYSRSNNDQEVDRPVSSSNIDVDNLNADITLNWTLFDGFRMFADRSKYNELASQGEYAVRNRIENSVVAISIAYFNLVRQEQLLQVARDTRDISETRLGRERVRHELGGSSSTDLLNAQVAFNADQSALLTRELEIQIARQDLNVLLGQDPEVEFTVSTEIRIPELDAGLSEIMTVALESNSGLKAAELGKKVADRGVQSARASFFPRLSAFANYGYTDQTVNNSAGLYPGLDVGTETKGTTVGLNLSFNLFNGRLDKITFDNARIEAANETLALRDARNRLTAAVREIYSTYRQRMDVVTLEEQNIEAARQNLDLQRDRHELGVATSLEFRDAQVSFVQSQTSLITARYQARISRLELDQLTGSLNVGE